jgi:hypothetical protein
MRAQDVVGTPLANMQHTHAATKDGVFRMVQSIHRLCTVHQTDERLRRNFDRYWPDFEAQLALLPKADEAVPEPREPEEVLGEVLETLRALERQAGRPSRSISYVADEDPWRAGTPAREILYGQVRSRIDDLLADLELLSWRWDSFAHLTVFVKHLDEGLLSKIQRTLAGVVPDLPDLEVRVYLDGSDHDSVSWTFPQLAP